MSPTAASAIDKPQGSPFSNFMRSTAGKKLYYYNEKTGPLPPNKICDQTKLSENR